MHHHRTTSQPRDRRERGERGERGASLVEYALLLALIAIVVFSAVSFFGTSTSGGFTRSASCIEEEYAGNNSGC